jgi:hypothetical protein
MENYSIIRLKSELFLPAKEDSIIASQFTKSRKKFRTMIKVKAYSDKMNLEFNFNENNPLCGLGS